MEELFRTMMDFKANQAKLKLCLIGGGNLLGKGHDRLGIEIAESLLEILRKMNNKPIAMELGGTQRRSGALDVESGRVTFTVGDSIEHLLWEA
jgi:chemotaxis protein CheD